MRSRVSVTLVAIKFHNITEQSEKLIQKKAARTAMSVRNMMIRYSGILLAGIFAILSGLHFYWAAGGKFGSAVAIPSVDGVRALNPSPAATIVVAVLLIIAMLVILGQLGLLGSLMPKWIFRWATFGIAVVFFLRAIGDFKLVGFFKQINDTAFSFWDTWLFSPLCLFIALVAFLTGIFGTEIEFVSEEIL